MTVYFTREHEWIRVEGDTATARTYLQAQHTHLGSDPERHLTFGGVYDDELAVPVAPGQ